MDEKISCRLCGDKATKLVVVKRGADELQAYVCAEETCGNLVTSMAMRDLPEIKTEVTVTPLPLH